MRVSEIFLSLKTKCLAPSLTAVSASTHISSILFFKPSLVSKVQSMIFALSLKNSKNLLNCEFDKIGLSRTYIFSSVKFSKSSIFPKLPKRVFRLITSFSLKESMGGLVT